MIEKLPILKKGKSGIFVERLQSSLMNWKLFIKAEIDGNFGSATEKRVKEFQNFRLTKDKCKFSIVPLTPTGIVDRNTWCELLQLKPTAIEIIEIKELITKAQANAIFDSAIHYDELADLNACLQKFEINNPLRIRHFVAQIAHESGGLRYFKELDSGWDYEYRDDLGNTEPGDGPLFKGAGALQMTGRTNYRAFADFMKDSKIMQGVDYVAATYPFSSGGFWWYRNKMNALIDGGATCREVSAKVNGIDPANGLSDRLYYYSKANQIIV